MPNATMQSRPRSTFRQNNQSPKTIYRSSDSVLEALSFRPKTTVAVRHVIGLSSAVNTSARTVYFPCKGRTVSLL